MRSDVKLLQTVDQQIEIVEEQKNSVQTLETSIERCHIPAIVLRVAVDGVKPVELMKMNVRTKNENQSWVVEKW